MNENKTGLNTTEISPNEGYTAISMTDRTAAEKVAFATVYAALVALVVVVNLLVICAYCKNRKLQTATNFLFVYLAASDLLVGTVSVPLWTIHEYIGAVKMPPTFLQVYYFFDMFSALSSIIFLAAVSVERYLAISKPIYHRICPLRYYYVVGFVIWLCVLTLAVVFVQDLGPTWRKYRGLVSFLFGFFLPLCVIFTMYFLIWKSIKQFESRRRSSASYRNKLRALKRERRSAWTVAIVIGLFVVSWLPFFTFSVLYVLCGDACMPEGVHARHAVDVVKFLHYSNSAINPFVYGYRNVDMRRTVWGILTCRRSRRLRQLLPRVPPRPYVMERIPPIVRANGLVHTHCVKDTKL